MRVRPFIGTLCGIAIGGLAIATWMLTFDPHGGVEWSHYLFPISAIVLERIYPARSIPVLLWYAGALLQWVAIGAIVDLLRGAFRRG